MSRSRRWRAAAGLALVLILLLVGYLLWKDGLPGFLNKYFDRAALMELGPGAGLLQTALFGFLASFHCIGMCSGTVLSLATGEQPWKRELLFNAGRVLCCTAEGAVLGGMGQVVSVNVHLRALIPLLCALAMAIMSLQILGFLRWLRIGDGTGIVGRFRRKGDSGAFLLGLMTGLLPCGMLQVVQLSALGSENALSGMMIMLVFSVSTTPLLFSFGILAGKLNALRQRTVTVLSALFILWMAARMALKGLRLMGVIL